MQLSRDYAVTRRITLKLYITLYSKSLNPTLYISPPSSVGSVLGLKSKSRWFEPRVNHYFSSSNVRLLASRSLQVKTNSQNEWSVTNQIGYTGLRHGILVFSLFVGCFYRKGPALNARCLLVIIHLLRHHLLQWQVHNILEISRFKSAFFEPIGKQRWRSVWIIYSTFPQNGIWPNLTGSKCSIMSSTSKFVFFGPIQKQSWPPLSTSLIGWGIFNFSSSIACGTEFDETWHEASILSSTKFLGYVFFLCVCVFFGGGGCWPEFKENKYVRVVNFTACRTCYDSPIVWLASRLCLISY